MTTVFGWEADGEKKNASRPESRFGMRTVWMRAGRRRAKLEKGTGLKTGHYKETRHGEVAGLGPKAVDARDAFR
jgi:hypothetical protein